MVHKNGEHNINRRTNLKIRFSKIKGSDIDVTYIDDNKEQHLLPCSIVEGVIDVVGFYSIDPEHSETTYNRLVQEINSAYAEHIRKKAEAKRQRDSMKQENHWWNTLSVRDKYKLVRPLKDRMIYIVDALLDKNTNDIKRRHYESLIKRSQLGSIDVSHKLDAKKLRKLPQLDPTLNRLHGSLYSFIALAEVCYPSLRSARPKSLTLY